ncbi:MAG: hypothetical protein LiPW15_142 [Parcubacteria group bacterium LiPW_15]|nr:MAG: hypothetical protein LiPW15_142 [Parcubacteria group bacterium LiPW_15]
MSHKNPTGCWVYKGSYSVLLADEAGTNHLPPGAVLSGRTVRVQDGSVAQSMGGINLYAEGISFGWGYKGLKEIRDGRGKLLWQNKDYR